MRWLIFIIVFLISILVSFWAYIQYWRVELTSTTIERACYPNHVSLRGIDFPNRRTIVLRDLSFTSDDQCVLLYISKATVSTSSTSWLSWYVIPSNSPLHLDRVAVSIASCSPISFKPSDPSLLLDISTMTVHWPDRSITTHKNLCGYLHEILEKVASQSAEA